MADFSSLPNELISEIWSNIHDPEDVESFALVSKHLCVVGRPFIEEHDSLKCHFKFMEIGAGINMVAPASLLKEVLLRPRIALYVTHLFIGRFRHKWDDPDDDKRKKNAHVPYPDNVMTLFVETIRNSSFLPPDQVSHWITCVKAGDEDPIIALLYMLLPKLSMVTLIDGGFDGKKSQETILRIAGAEKTSLLTRLVAVTIQCEYYHGGGGDFGWLRAFAALPSVQSLCFDQMEMYSVDEVIKNAQYFVPDSYNIRELTFTKNGPRPKLLAQLLESIKGLKVFNYLYQRCEFNPFWIRLALLASAKHSLEYLRILPDCIHQYKLIGSLRGFTALKGLEINVSLLCCQCCVSAYDGLANLLPSSIEKIYLDTRSYEPPHIVPILVEELVKGKSRLIPHLKALMLETQPDNRIIRRMSKSLEEKCQNFGIELTIF